MQCVMQCVIDVKPTNLAKKTAPFVANEDAAHQAHNGQPVEHTQEEVVVKVIDARWRAWINNDHASVTQDKEQSCVINHKTS